MTRTAQALLERFGYEVRFSSGEWTECLLVQDNESWLGRGLDREAALKDALRHACPSLLSRALLEDALRAGETAVRVPPRDRSTERRAVTPALVARRVPRPPSFDRSLRELRVLSDRIRDFRVELGLCSPERQRLAILAWICEARAHTDAFPDDRPILEEVAVISRQLTELGKAFWPGSVTALQLHMQPSELPKTLLGGTATTWTRAAELAERALWEFERLDERRGHDVYGWADHDVCLPAPPSADVRLQQLYGAVESFGGALDRQAVARGMPEPLTFLGWVRTLRWLRGRADPERWARIAGRLRWWAGRRDPSLTDGSRELDAAFVPDRSWAGLLGEDGVPAPPSRGSLDPETADRVRSALAGKRIAFVSRSRDPTLLERLAQAFPDALLEWKAVEAVRLETLSESIREGTYDMVLGAFGLQARDVDHLLAAACADGEAAYVRVNRGRPESCIRGLVAVI